jgi:thiol-disulfide isomerase/thioredoxin
MNKHFLFVIFGLLISCSGEKESFHYQNQDEWKLAYRIVESEHFEDYELAASQLDSLIEISRFNFPPGIFNVGLRSMAKAGQIEKMFVVLSKSNQELQSRICNEDWFQSLPLDERKAMFCKTSLDKQQESYSHPEVRHQLLVMFINDQYTRGVAGASLEARTKLDVASNLYEFVDDPFETDFHNREQLKAIIDKHGFPTKAMVGELGMTAVFLVVQHSDRDKEFQASKLKYLDKAAKKGDVDKQDYAYLFDRIKVNAGEPQLYGSQWSNIDFVNAKATLFEVTDPDNLDKRRMEMGMMPISIYKNFMFSIENKDYMIKKRKKDNVRNGKAAPAGTFLDPDKNSLSLSDFKGKLVVIDFWATWCSPCIKLAPKFKEAAEKYKDEEVVFISISIDDSFDFWKGFVDKHNWGHNNYWMENLEQNPLFSFLYEEMKSADSKSMIYGLPRYVFISQDGKILNNASEFPGTDEFDYHVREYLTCGIRN